MSIKQILCVKALRGIGSMSSAFPITRYLMGIHTNQIRCVWREAIRQGPSNDPNRQGEMTFEDPDVLDTRIGRAVRAEAPLRRKIKFLRHEKAWMARKRLKMENRYLRKKEAVEELLAYIKFKKPGR